MILNGWSVLGTGTRQRQLKGWITLAHELRGCSSWWSLWQWECGRVPHMVGPQDPEAGHPQAGIPFRTGQTSHSTASTASQAAPPAEDHHEARYEPVEDILHSNHDILGIYLICAGPSMTERPYLSCSDGLASLVYDCLVSGIVSGCLSTQEQHCSCVGCWGKTWKPVTPGLLQTPPSSFLN